MALTRRDALAATAGVTAALLTRTVRAGSRPVRRIGPGRVEGDAIGGIERYLGVRYGEDTASTRFGPPRPAQPWRGLRPAHEYGPACPQRGLDEPQSEDCLFLNVFTPSSRASQPRPVMMYVHGGAYSSGSGSSPLYDGSALCARGDAVVVTLNHRLNVFGHLSLARLLPGERFAASGNAGLLDLVLALRWVRDHIAVFGGDPDRVLLFGQSGGGAKIVTLMATPAAAGLFHRAATMSGQQLTASGPLNAARRTAALLDALGLPVERAAEVAAVPAARLVEALAARDPIIERGALYWGPVLDHEVLPRHPFYPDAPPQSASVPMIIGNTRDETRSLIGRADPATFALEWQDLAVRLAREMRVDISPEHVIAEYRRLYPHYSPSELFFAATTAARSWRAAIVEAELRAAQGRPAYAYQLDFASPVDGGRWGAHHTLDIPLVFGTLTAPGSLTGDDAAARSTSRAMQAAFIAFAHSGSPQHDGIPTWEPYLPERRATLVFDATPRSADDPRGAERRLFAAVPFIQQGT